VVTSNKKVKPLHNNVKPHLLPGRLKLNIEDRNISIFIKNYVSLIHCIFNIVDITSYWRLIANYVLSYDMWKVDFFEKKFTVHPNLQKLS